MGKIYCTECGTQLDDSALFCSKCGASVESDDVNGAKTNTSANTNNSTNETVNNLVNTILKEPKIIILLVVVFLLIVGIFALMGSGSDLVDVTEVVFETGIHYGDTPFGGAIESAATMYADEQQEKVFEETGKTLSEKEYQDLQDKYIKEHGGTTNDNAGEYVAAVAFKIIPKETISGVNSFKLNNFKVTYENGVTEDLGSITFNNKNTYLANNEYGFHYKYYTNEDVRNQKVHISADIVIDTLNEQNKVIGHLDYDVTADAWSATYA